MNKEQKLMEKFNILNKTIMEEIQKDIHTFGLGDIDIFSELKNIYLKEAKKEQNKTSPCSGYYRQMDLEECIEIEKAHKEKEYGK